ncbi:DUF4352 domain-containing protein [Gordonia sp. NB41Y]|uniref:DUF4352 domain-containing protein n=1 Tax=Gordonia sp. NB41Y TaxID=875808 RepID=UPI0006B174E1|nr:DUF4352 domain-containing protein [Gordonia sp. NB41Y]EMP14561.2 Mpr protein [Gordonia sp. NB41Y]WLP91688.1 DUF4352 domain-containing protein [Gordonia sp. NB41Y]
MTDPQNTSPYGEQPQYAAVPNGGAPNGGAPNYGAPNYGAQYGIPPQPPVPTPPQKKRKWPWIVGALVVLIIIIAVMSGTSGDDQASRSGSSATTAQDGGSGGGDQTPGLNTPVRDGKFEFVVTGVEKGLSSVGDNPYLTEKAQGQFVIVTMTVKNISDKAYSFSPTDQKLFDAQGRSFEPSTSAQIALGDSDIPVWDNINPGNTVTAKVVYDMPADAQPASIELHDSLFSGGAKVALS